MLSKIQLTELINFRKTLHQYPELSGNELKTRDNIIRFIKRYCNKPDIRYFGKTGFAIFIDSGNQGKHIVIRGDMDALPIHELSDLPYKSEHKGISHACGHDGHTTILLGVILTLINNPLKKGKVTLLFQHAEETGQGALEIINNENFKDLNPDYVFGFHNLPGYNENTILLSNRTFSSYSVGMIIKLYGKTSHASEPEKGNSPALAVANFIQKIIENNNKYPDGTFATVIFSRIGEVAFGTAPGYAEIMLTVRSNNKDYYEKIKNDIINNANFEANKFNLQHQIEWREEFAAIENNKECVDYLVETSNILNRHHIFIEKPFRWSEDFGFYSQKYKSGFFGFGTGLNKPSLHNPDYDFNDETILPTITFINKLIKVILK